MARPDFGPFPQGGGARHEVIKSLLASLAQGWRKEIPVLEVGSWTGASALMLANAVADFFPQKGTVLCVDLWEPYASEHDLHLPIYDGMDEMLRSGGAFALFKSNVLNFAPEGVRIAWHRGRLSDLAHMRKAFGLIYIDGSHYLEDVKADIAAAKLLVGEEGIICGDDLEVQGSEVDLAVAGAIGTHVDYATDGGPGHYHPGVTVAVWEAFGPVWSQAGVWAVKEKGGAWTSPF